MTSMQIIVLGHYAQIRLSYSSPCDTVLTDIIVFSKMPFPKWRGDNFLSFWNIAKDFILLWLWLMNLSVHFFSFWSKSRVFA